MEPSSAPKKTPRRTPRKARSLCVPFAREATYARCLSDRAYYRHYLLEQYQAHPELFPSAWSAGFHFHGVVQSKKQGLRQCRVKLKGDGGVYQRRPSFMMPYMIGRVEAVEKPLLLRRWGVPFDALAYVFGRDPMYWYRAYVSLGRASVVGTTLKAAERLPAHVIADEKHTRCRGQRVFIPTTVADNCILGAEVVEAADTPTLTDGYQVFADEAGQLDPAYAPQTVNTDGWQPTQAAWKTLFPSITLVLCFFHAVLAVKNRCRRTPTLGYAVCTRLWQVYAAPTLAAFAQRIRRLREDLPAQPLLDSVQEKLRDICDQADAFKAAYRHPGCYRTSNGLERLMNYQHRLLWTMQYFHGTPQSATLYVRAMALVWNFHPYGRKTQQKEGRYTSPFERINQFRYHDNWLENMMIAASLRGKHTPHKIR